MNKNISRWCLVATVVGCAVMGHAAYGQATTADELRAIQSLAEQTLPKGSTILATCGASEGRGYYVTPQVDPWVDEKISGGRYVIFVDANNEPNILFRDARGEFINAKDDGAYVMFSLMNEENGAFGLIETYPKTGVTQTYVVVKGADSERYMLWTSVKAHVGVANITKASAFKSNCI